MNNFQKVIAIIFIILLIICLIIVGHALYKKKYETAYPPVVEDCPDYWLDMSNGNASNCVNIKNLGSCSGPMDFSGLAWQGSKGLCNKYHWAKKCGIKWDGVTNTTDACSRDSGSGQSSDDGPCPICPSIGSDYNSSYNKNTGPEAAGSGSSSSGSSSSGSSSSGSSSSGSSSSGSSSSGSSSSGSSSSGSSSSGSSSSGSSSSGSSSSGSSSSGSSSSGSSSSGSSSSGSSSSGSSSSGSSSSGTSEDDGFNVPAGTTCGTYSATKWIPCAGKYVADPNPGVGFSSMGIGKLPDGGNQSDYSLIYGQELGGQPTGEMDTGCGGLKGCGEACETENDCCPGLYCCPSAKKCLSVGGKGVSCISGCKCSSSSPQTTRTNDNANDKSWTDAQKRYTDHVLDPMYSGDVDYWIGGAEYVEGGNNVLYSWSAVMEDGSGASWYAPEGWSPS